MSTISSYNSPMRGYDQGSLDRFSSRSTEQREAMALSKNQSLELSLTTKEGDVVTLQRDSFMDFASLSYDKSGKVFNGYETASTSLSTREMTLTSGSQFTFSVQGNLSEDELDDIENLIKTLDEVTHEMASGNMDGAMETAMGLSEGYESISGFEADLSTSSAFRYEREMSTREAYSNGGVNGDARAFGRSHNPNRQGVSDYLNADNAKFENRSELLADSSSRLLDMMLDALEEMKEENQKVSTRAAGPVDQLLSHHMNALQQGDEDTSGGLDGDESGPADNDLMSQLAVAREGMQNEFRRMMSEFPGVGGGASFAV